jgi:hypothetical protein
VKATDPNSSAAGSTRVLRRALPAAAIAIALSFSPNKTQYNVSETHEQVPLHLRCTL